MGFDKSVWDDSDPSYAPCIKHRKDRGTYFWRPPKKYLDAGYAVKTYALPGCKGDGLDYDRARQCRALTREMLEWYDGETNGRQPGTWGWLIARYKHDQFSGIHEVRPTTRADYLKALARVENAIGNVLIEETNYERMMTWRRSMQEKGRSVHYIKKWFTHWGLVNSHGIKIGELKCRELKIIREEMRLKNPASRSTCISRDQVNAVVAEADKRGQCHVSLSVLIRFEFMLRGVDVVGQWEDANGREGGIQDGGKMWVDGLTWDMISQDLSSLTKVISKTRDSLPEPYVYDLRNTPDIQRRLSKVPKERRRGPVITLPNGRPPKNGVVTRAFKQIIRDLKLPEELQIRDTRAGGISEAKGMVDPYSLRDAAQHTQVTTTDRYARNRSETANKVVFMRNGGT
ncbi:hypothetical protein MACH17_18050 [Phaeobacter inhibens]|uniref:hypothetical protein n=1 Tax=Phaeobacter inhibens TaxID=221822 RepID=UPI00276888B4|nr:hypothetical protein [Phaeobacter inhibens]GLO70288.1 hypothetical protein MACH17_18050 [Phaeobacter inhibens]